jgi:hypothetical protein
MLLEESRSLESKNFCAGEDQQQYSSNPVSIYTVCQARNRKKQISAYYILHVDFFLGLFFGPDEGGDLSLRNDFFFSFNISQKIRLSSEK